MFLCSFRRLCGKCVSAHICHVVFQSGLRGIIPLRNLLASSWPAGTAICCCETLDHRQPISHWASTGLLNYNISNIFCTGMSESNLSHKTNLQVVLWLLPEIITCCLQAICSVEVPLYLRRRVEAFLPPYNLASPLQQPWRKTGVKRQYCHKHPVLHT